MGRLALATIALALVPAGAAGAHPGHGPPVVAISEFAFAPAKVTVVEGDYVFWAWQGPDTNHSVTSDAGQAMAFDSDPTTGSPSHKVGDTWSLQFHKAGTFTYHCKVHSFMKGTIVVLTAPPQPVATKPRLSKVTAVRTGRKLVVRFHLNEAVSMRATIRRAAGGPVLHEFDFAGPPGANRRALKLGALKAGRYRLSLVAVDSSTGKATAPAVRSFTMA
jgi:plastocyanin